MELSFTLREGFANNKIIRHEELQHFFCSPTTISQYISNKMQRYTVYLYLETALHVSGGSSTHYQERIQLYLQHLVFVTPLLLSAGISWNRFECAVGGVRHLQHTLTSWLVSVE
jgi:hypothetical protein